MSFESYLKDKGLSDSTIKLYVTAVNQYLQTWAIEELREWKKVESKRISPNTLNSRIYALRAFCVYLGIQCTIKPVSIVLPEYLDDVLTKAQYQKLLEGLEKDGKREYWCTIKLLGMTGLRISEALQVTKRDIINKRMQVRCKGDKYRKVDFPKKLRDDILPFLEDGYVIKVKAGTLRSMLKASAKRYKINPHLLHPHEFRAFFARSVYEKTKDVRLVQGLLGHSSLKTTMRYLRQCYKGVGRKLSRIVDW